jgi:hypothetical protein
MDANNSVNLSNLSDGEYIQNSKYRNKNESIETDNPELSKYEDDNKNICSVEMKNNNKVYIEFKEDWTVKNVRK